MAESRPRPLAGATAATQGLLSCSACGLLCRPARHGNAGNCPRCAAPLCSRIHRSVLHTWAYLIAAYILYIPANLLPIMQTGSLAKIQTDTIMSGVVYLWESGSRMLALIVFMASIVIPLFKLLALTLLTISVQRRSVWLPLHRARLYRVVEAIGRWSMLDIYVVALLVALVQIKSFATVEAGPGAAAFGTVVVLTLLAAKSFDPRLIWDFIKTDND
ncbi:paraquat-inducible protein A [Actimicrobium sp. GrIS 1.19]|uniref:paraquat-inducible protein A n=1 Tax=Actimicrobium sp. GrIS 1.19 TaxID=3071708 RepID=UPI002E06678E|nr:paraquat-inducible protein A [Actimicrobium sp. GrIS 1.19]